MDAVKTLTFDRNCTVHLILQQDKMVSKSKAAKATHKHSEASWFSGTPRFFLGGTSLPLPRKMQSWISIIWDQRLRRWSNAKVYCRTKVCHISKLRKKKTENALLQCSYKQSWSRSSIKPWSSRMRRCSACRSTCWTSRCGRRGASDARCAASI